MLFLMFSLFTTPGLELLSYKDSPLSFGISFSNCCRVYARVCVCGVIFVIHISDCRLFITTFYSSRIVCNLTSFIRLFKIFWTLYWFSCNQVNHKLIFLPFSRSFSYILCHCIDLVCFLRLYPLFFPTLSSINSTPSLSPSLQIQ